MVGALSIVRFRTPIKNPLELVIYFFLITLGIVTNVDPNLSVNFTLFFALVAVLSEIYRIIANKLNFKVNLQKEFDYYLRIELHKENNELDKIENLYINLLWQITLLIILDYSQLQKLTK